MSIANIRRAFQEGLGDVASCNKATMAYAGAGKGHVLKFWCVVKSKQQIVEDSCPCSVQPDVYAGIMGQKWAEEWGKGK